MDYGLNVSFDEYNWVQMSTIALLIFNPENKEEIKSNTLEALFTLTLNSAQMAQNVTDRMQIFLSIINSIFQHIKSI